MVALPLENFRVLTTNDATQALHGVRTRHPRVVGLEGDPRQRRWQICTNHVRLGNSTITSVATDGRTLQLEHGSALLFASVLSGRMEIELDRKARSFDGRGLALGPTSAHKTAFSDDSTFLIIKTERDFVESILRELGVSLDVETFFDVHFGQFASPEMKALTDGVWNLVRELDHDPANILDLPRFLAAQDQILAIRIAHTISRISGQPPLQREATRSPGLTRCIDYIHAHADKLIDLRELARASGFSLRTMQWQFKKGLGVTITGYIRRHRLERARARLERPQEGDTVTSIALGCGFSHLSEFAAAYRSHYGESPSDTLHSARARRTP